LVVRPGPQHAFASRPPPERG